MHHPAVHCSGEQALGMGTGLRGGASPLVKALAQFARAPTGSGCAAKTRLAFITVLHAAQADTGLLTMEQAVAPAEAAEAHAWHVHAA